MKQIAVFFLAVLMIFSVCACTEKNEVIQTPSVPDEAPTDLIDAVLPITMKEQAKLVVGEEKYDVKTSIELKAGHQMSELGYSVVSDDTVASVDESGVLTRKGYGQVSVQIFLKSNPAVFSIFNVTFAPANLYGSTYKGGFKKVDGSAGNAIELVLNQDKTFTLKVGEGQAKYLDADYNLDAKAVGEFTGTFEVDASSATPVSLTSAAYSSEPIKAAFGKTVDGAFCIRIKLNSVTVEESLKSVVIELVAQ